MMGRRFDIDWDRVQRLYRVGQLSVRDIAAECGVQPSSVSRRARRQGWTRDKQDEVRQLTNSALVVANGLNATTETAKATDPTREDLNVAVRSNVEVIRTHRGDVAKARRIVDMLMNQLEVAAEYRDAIGSAIIEDSLVVGSAIRRGAMLKAVSLPAHAAVMRDLATAMVKLVTIERQAYNIDDRDNEEHSYEALLRAALASEGEPLPT